MLVQRKPTVSLLAADICEEQTCYTQIRVAGGIQIGIQENITGISLVTEHMQSMEMKRILTERVRLAAHWELQPLT